MKKIISLSLILFITGSLFAQQAILSKKMWRFKYDHFKPNLNPNFQILDTYKDGFFVVKTKSKQTYLSLSFFSRTNVTLMWTKRIHFEGSFFEKIFQVEDGFLLFTSSYNKLLDRKELNVAKINFEGTIVSEKKEIDFITNYTKRKGKLPIFNIQLSANNAKMLIWAMETYQPAKTGKEFDQSFIILNKDLSQAWRGKIPFTYTGKFWADNLLIGNNGFIVGIARFTNATNPSWNNTYRFFGFDSETNKLLDYPLPSNIGFISKVQLNITASGNLIYSGFYSKDEKEVKLDGVFFNQVNIKTTTLIDAATKEIVDGMLVVYPTELTSKNFTTTYSSINEWENGFVMAAQKYHETYIEVEYTSNVTQSGFKTGSTTFRRYSNITLFNYNGKGKIDWVVQVPKEQNTSKDFGYYSSFAPYNSNNKLNFIYNADKKNVSKNKPEDFKELRKLRRAETVKTTVNENGQILGMEKIYSRRNQKVLFHNSPTKKLSSGEFVFYADKKWKYRLGILNVN